MYHNPETHTQQMVDSGINWGLPDFLYHKNLTLLPHHHLTHRVGDEDPRDESQHQHLTGDGVGRCKKTTRTPALYGQLEGSLPPSKREGWFKILAGCPPRPAPQSPGRAWQMCLLLRHKSFGSKEKAHSSSFASLAMNPGWRGNGVETDLVYPNLCVCVRVQIKIL